MRSPSGFLADDQPSTGVRRSPAALRRSEGRLRLGLPRVAAARVVAVLDRIPGAAARVPFADLAAALVEAAGPYRDDDPEDRRLAARLLRLLSTYLAVAGWTVEIEGTPDQGARVEAARRPRAQARSVVAVRWTEAGTHAALSRWARRAAEEATADPDDRPDDDAEPDGPGVPVAAIKAAAPQWPPPVTISGADQRLVTSTPGRPLVVDGELAIPSGCAGGADGVPCVPAPGGRWVCPRCRRVTPVVERAIGPRTPVCECYGDAVCIHPVRAR
jgi:hypothetical protein